MPDETPDIRPDMTILDIVSRYRRTEAVFKKYNGKAEVCLCCQALFEPLAEAADRYGLDLRQILSELKMSAEG